MNYYEHHLRDYDAATAHLTWDQDLAYTRLLRWYYRKEQPIPADIAEACRLVRATTAAQRKAVEQVLHEFFELQDDGWHKDTCDEVIAAFQAGEPERELKKSNEDLRLKRHREERAALFTQLNAAGRHAAWNTPIKELRALVEQACNEKTATAGAKPVTQPATTPATPATATHTPIPSTHSPVPTPQTPAPKGEEGVVGRASPSPAPKPTAAGAADNPRGTRLPRDWQLPKALGDWALAEYPHWTPEIVRRLAQQFRDHWVAKTGKDATKLDWPATWRNWCGSDITQRQFPPPKPAVNGVHQLDIQARNAEAKRLLFGSATPATPATPTIPGEVFDA